jgi:asparagine synthase (glutamine-hydrolysing)
MNSFIPVNKEHMHSNSFYMILNNDFYSIDKKMYKNVKPNHCEDFHRTCCCGFTGIKCPVINYKNVTLFFNGILHNYEEIMKKISMNVDEFNHEYEIIVHLYLQYGIEYTLQLLDGEFSFILIDDNLDEPETKLFVARDRIGTQPLYLISEKKTTKKEPHPHNENKTKLFGFSTCLSFLSDDINNTVDSNYQVSVFPPSSYSKYSIPYKSLSSWSLDKEFVKYNNFNQINFLSDISKFTTKTQLNTTVELLQNNLKEILYKKIKKIHEHQSNQNVACLLSGGLDSNIVTALACEYIKKRNKYEKLNLEVETFCIGFKESDDIREARFVANYLHTKHTEIIITEEEYMQTIPIVIQILETYDTVTIRAGVVQYLLCRYLNEKTHHRKIFTGDGADELMGGYLYLLAVPNMLEFDRECRNLLNNYNLNYGLFKKIFHYFEMERISPFLDQQFIGHYLSIPLEFRYSVWLTEFLSDLNGQENIFFKYSEKYLMRMAFSKEYYKNDNYDSILPEETLWRTKDDFFDGISNYPNSTHQIIDRNLVFYNPVNSIKKHVNITKEQEYYNDIFQHFFPNQESAVPRFWKLKYISPTNEPSAHALDFYFDYNPEYSERCL